MFMVKHQSGDIIIQQGIVYNLLTKILSICNVNICLGDEGDNFYVMDSGEVEVENG